MKTTLIFKATHKFNLDFKSTLKSTLISKRELLHIFKTTLISRQLEFSLVNDIHNVSIVSSEEGCEYYSLEQFSCCTIGVLIVCVKIFKYQCCIFSQRNYCVP